MEGNAWLISKRVDPRYSEAQFRGWLYMLCYRKRLAVKP